MLRVLFQNRADALANWGGDTTQMEMTRRYLERMGVQVTVDLDCAPDFAPGEFDLVHIFNIQDAGHGLRQLENAKAKGKPVALSTIYWDMSSLARSSKLRLWLNRVHEATPYAWLNRIPLYASTSMGRRKHRYQLMRRMLLGADLLLPNSYAEAEQLALQFDAPSTRAKVVVVPNGVDDERLLDAGGAQEPLDPSLPERFVLQVGRIEPIKGQLKVLEALMDRPDLPLVFLGKGSEGYLERCRELGARRGNTYFPGVVPPEQVERFYRRAKVHVLPSLRESPGLATLEAAVFGANCVVSCHGPVAEYFGQDVWYCDPGETATISNAVVAAWDAPCNGRLRSSILEKFTWREAASRTLEGYLRLVPERGGEAA